MALWRHLRVELGIFAQYGLFGVGDWNDVGRLCEGAADVFHMVGCTGNGDGDVTFPVGCWQEHRCARAQ